MQSSVKYSPNNVSKVLDQMDSALLLPCDLTRNLSDNDKTLVTNLVTSTVKRMRQELKRGDRVYGHQQSYIVRKRDNTLISVDSKLADLLTMLWDYTDIETKLSCQGNSSKEKKTFAHVTFNSLADVSKFLALFGFQETLDAKWLDQQPMTKRMHEKGIKMSNWICDIRTPDLNNCFKMGLRLFRRTLQQQQKHEQRLKDNKKRGLNPPRMPSSDSTDAETGSTSSVLFNFRVVFRHGDIDRIADYIRQKLSVRRAIKKRRLD